jgi:hypothetical protein
MGERIENGGLEDFNGFDSASTEALEATVAGLDRPSVASDGGHRPFIVATDAASPDRLPGLMNGVSPAAQTELIMRAVRAHMRGDY